MMAIPQNAITASAPQTLFSALAMNDLAVRAGLTAVGIKLMQHCVPTL